MKQINNDIDDANRNIRQLQDKINSLKTSTDEYAFEAEQKTIAGMTNLISKSNALNLAATEQQNLLDSFVKKGFCWLKRKKNCNLY